MLAVAALAAVGWLAGAARAEEPEIDVSGRIQGDLRFRVFAQRAADTVGLFGPEPDPVRPNKVVGSGSWHSPTNLPPPVVRNQNLLNVQMYAKSGRYRGRVDADFVMTGYPGTLGYPGRIDQLADLSNRAVLQPSRVEVHALYMEARDVGLDGLDLRIGNQLVQFGVGDQFNPTNVFNPNDVEDVMQFGEQMGNVMVRADYAVGNWTLTGVLIPVFMPSLIPQTGALALTRVSRLPFYEDPLRWRIHSEAELARLQGFPTQVGAVDIQLPEATPENMPFGFNLGGFVGGHDVGVMYYRGFADVPIATANHARQEVFDEPLCRGELRRQCISGKILNDVTLQYPRIQVVGGNFAGEVNPLFFLANAPPPLGYRLEVAVVFPELVRATLTQDEIAFGPLVQPAGEYDYGPETPGDGPHGGRPVVLDDTPYAKWVAGLDYTFGKHLMVNGQWVHGMLDELGAGDNLLQPRPDGYTVRDGGVKKVPDGEGGWVNQDCGLPRLIDPDGQPGPGTTCVEEVRRRRLSDLAVIGFDVNFASRAGLLRLFTITDLTGIRYESYDEARGRRVGVDYGPFTRQGRSGVVLAELDWNFGDGFDLAGGLLYQYGQPYTKFGDPATGGSFVFTRARYAF